MFINLPRPRVRKQGDAAEAPVVMREGTGQGGTRGCPGDTLSPPRGPLTLDAPLASAAAPPRPWTRRATSAAG